MDKVIKSVTAYTLSAVEGLVAFAEAQESQTVSLAALKELVESYKKDLVEKSAALAKGKKVRGASTKPKRAPSAYNLFIKQVMAELRQENPDLLHKDLMGKAAEKWRETKGAAAPAPSPAKDEKPTKAPKAAPAKEEKPVKSAPADKKKAKK
jgi:hypothetical protein